MIILCIVIAYLVHRIRVKPPIAEEKQTRTMDENGLRNIYDVDSNYEEIDDDHSTYTALQRPAPGESSEDHVYAHLNQALNNIQKNQRETGF